MFFLVPGKWLGEGEIQISGAHESIHYYTKWEIEEPVEGFIHAVQQVEKEGVKEKIVNHYFFSNVTDTAFILHLQNEVMGKVEGKGVIKENHIRWSFPDETVCPGFEEYQLSESDTYILNAQFSSENYQTKITGKIWKA